MKPGRELDALVAEHVFGWRRSVENGYLRLHRPDGVLVLEMALTLFGDPVTTQWWEMAGADPGRANATRTAIARSIALADFTATRS